MNTLFMVAVSSGAQEIFSLLPHEFVEPSKLPDLTSSQVASNVLLRMQNNIV